MRILVTVVASHVDLENDNISLDVFPEMTVKDIKAIVADEIKVTSASQHYFYNNQPLADENKTLTELNIGEGDMLALAIQDPQASAPRRRTQQAEQNQQRAQRPRQGPDPEQLRLQLLADPRVMEEVRSQAPDIAEAAHDRDRFHAAWDERSRQMEAARLEKEEQIALLNADPFNMEAQEKIENMIRQERVQENMHKALEENPECECGIPTMLQSMLTLTQLSPEWLCSTLTSSSIMSLSKPLLTQARKPLSCHPTLQRNATLKD